MNETAKPEAKKIEEKKAVTKNQHYVPQFYQRFFSADPKQKTIGAYAIKQRKYIPTAPIKSQSSGDYFYSDNQDIEDALGKMEEIAANVIKQIIADPKVKLSKEDNYTLYAFTFMQIGRTLDRANFLQESANASAKTILKKIVEAKRNSPNAAEVELLTDDVLDAVNFNLGNAAMFSLGQHASMVNTCIDLKMKVLVNKTRAAFITSDNPACMYSRFIERVGDATYALGSKGLMFYMPINRDLALLYYDPTCYKVGDKKKTYVELTQPSDIFNLNKLSACYANEMLYCLNGSISTDEIEKLVKMRERFRPERRVETIEGIKYEGGEIVGARTNSIYCKLSLTFMKELPTLKAITPQNYNHMRNGLRPIAYYKNDLTIKANVNPRK